MRTACGALALVLWLGTSAASPARSELVVEGRTMGTGYTVRVPRPEGWTAPALESAVEEILEGVDAAMSTWRSDSELERFNRSRGTQWVAVSPGTARVAAAARALAERSGGAFDPTVRPLVRHFGFGPDPPRPGPAVSARAVVGFRLFDARERPPALRKERAEVELDLSGIAKGHAVDEIAARLLAAGTPDFLVEIGGEIRARGVSPRGGPWAVAIEDPLARGAGPHRAVLLRDEAIATSGSYRNFVFRDGARLPHVIDPHTGTPVAGDLVSVSVIAPTAMAADGWATALFAAGPETGWDLARREALAALFVSARGGDAARRSTAAFDARWRERGGPEETPR